MRALAGACLGIGIGFSILGGLDLLIHTARPDLGRSEPTMNATGRYLAAQARTARRIAPFVTVAGLALTAIGLLIALLFV